MIRFASALSILLAPATAWAGAASRPAPKAEPIRYGPAKKLCTLADQRVHESSGLAASRLRKDQAFWTHNDSGDRPRVYAFDPEGRDLGTFDVTGAGANDWEDMASFRLEKKAFLLLADVGDNARRRKSCQLYIVREPSLPPPPAAGKKIKPRRGELKVVVKITFTYADGPHDCEAVAVDPVGKSIFLATKDNPFRAKIYRLPLPTKSPKEPLTARPIAQLPVILATGMDLSPDGRRAVIVNYAAAYEYVRKGDEKWKAAFARLPRSIPVPPRRQGESIAYGADGRSLYLTSEKTPTPLFEVPALPPSGKERGQQAPTPTDPRRAARP